jgi:hypothetical protein
MEISGKYLSFLVTAKLKVLATLENYLMLMLASVALQTKDNLFSSLGLLMENRLGLTTIASLLSVVTSLTYNKNPKPVGNVHKKYGNAHSTQYLEQKGSLSPPCIGRPCGQCAFCTCRCTACDES